MLKASLQSTIGGFSLQADLEFLPGWHVVLGSNGSGKSTLLRFLAGAAKPDAGLVSWNYIPVYANIDYYYSLGYLPQDFRAYPDMTVRQFLDYICRSKLIPRQLIKERIDQLLQELELTPWGGSLTKSLSGGSRQRLGLAQALLSDPQVLILDEPTMGLDAQERLHFLELLNRLAASRTVVMGSNHPEEADERCDTVTVLDKGSILAMGNAAALCGQLQGRLWQDEGDQPSGLVLEEIKTSQGWKYVIVADIPPVGAKALEPGLHHWYRWLKLTSPGK